LGWLLGFVVDDVSVLLQLADERIDLAQAQAELGLAFQVAAHEAILRNTDFEGSGAGIFDSRQAVFLGQREQTLNAPQSLFSVALVQALTELADMLTGFVRTSQQLRRSLGDAPRRVLRKNAMTATLLAQMLAQQLAGLGIEQADVDVIPLHVD
jgi:hypothetical protein